MWSKMKLRIGAKSMHAQSLVAVMLCGLILSGCARDQYVKRDEFDRTIGGLRATDAELADGLAGIRGQFTEMTRDLHGKFSDYDATIANLQGRLRVEMTAHFGFDDSTLREEDKPALAEFASVIQQYSPHVVVTVEGFTDPAGDPDYNKWLGQRRAESVRQYLIEEGRLPSDKVVAVSYGGDERRMLRPGAWGKGGEANRRVSLVVDYVGPTPN